ncbi:MAG TPA: ABC transporter substrate-binding protein [Syntrophomonadaceae bacterium]|nr:ABC transporter substrate-binding protein [Syntrophomonadaceae bacterium]
MRLSRKVSVVVLTMFMLSILVGCGGNAEKDPGQEGSKTDGTIKIGINSELSGNVASYGTNARDGAMLAIETINASGGVLGQQLEAVVRDCKSLPDEAMSVSASLIDEGIVAQIGPLTSGNVAGSTPVMMESQVPLIAPAATADPITFDEKTNKVRDYIFRVCYSDSYQGTIMAAFATDNLEVKNVVIFKDASSDYGKGLADYFKEAFIEKGGKIIAEEGFVKGDRDFRATLTKIRGMNPDFIYVPGYYEEVAPLIKQARELGINVPIGGPDGWDSPDLVGVVGADNLNKTYFTNHYSVQDESPKVVEFVEAYKAKYNKDPDAFAALAYDSVYLLAQAITDAGEADPQKITEALAVVTDFEGVTGTMRIDDKHNPVKGVVILEHIDGKQVMNTRIQP